MKYTIELKLAGLAKDVTDRPDLFFVQGNDEIDHLCDYIGWDQLDEDKPTAMWAEVEDGDYGDIYCTFSSMPSSIYNTVYRVIRKMESVLGPDYDQEGHIGKPTPEGVLHEIIIELEDADPDWIGARLQSLLDAGEKALGLYKTPDLDPLRDSLRPILDQVDGTRDELLGMCQVDNSLALANFYRELTVVADGLYGFIYGEDRS